MESISAVIWTFSVSLIMFCINSKRTTICGTSYEQLIILLEGKYGFLRKKSTRCTSILVEENYWISPFKILEVLILVSIVGTAFFSSQESNCGILFIILIQIVILLIFIGTLWNMIRMDGVEKEIQKYIQKNFHVWENLLKDHVQSNWERLIIKDSFEQAAYTAEERDTLFCWVHTIEKVIYENMNRNDNYEIVMYQKVFRTILVNDDRFSKRWNFVLADILNSADDRRINKMKALTYLLAEHTEEYGEKYLYEFLKTIESIRITYNYDKDMYIWAAAYNYARSRELNEDWRRIYFRNIYELVAIKYGYSQYEVEKQLQDEIDEVIKYRKIVVKEAE